MSKTVTPTPEQMRALGHAIEFFTHQESKYRDGTDQQAAYRTMKDALKALRDELGPLTYPGTPIIRPMVNPAIQDKRCYWQCRPGPGFSWATCATRADAIEYAGGDDPTVGYELREVWMTPKEFESMPEHAGW